MGCARIGCPRRSDDPRIARLTAALSLIADPSLVQSIGVYVAQHSEADVRSLFEAALGYDPLGETDAVDPLRRGPQLAFNPITSDAPARGRTHLDTRAPMWWTIASPDNHGVDIAAWTDTWGD